LNESIPPAIDELIQESLEEKDLQYPIEPSSFSSHPQKVGGLVLEFVARGRRKQ
jgi:hypothetical protein